MQILLVEDEIHVAGALQAVLRDAGYRVVWAATGQRGLELLAEQSFDLLVADLYLPDMDGLEVVRQARAQRPPLPVIVITGYSSLDSAIAALRLGTADYLEKPFTAEEITACIQRVLAEGGGAGRRSEQKPTPLLKY
ncbi:MAG: response regulator [Desulfobacca sp.]|uniref:response regulator n=1 Tax=Desulfobacca sp. TaxID=2067990 RepID=UPI004049249D